MFAQPSKSQKNTTRTNKNDDEIRESDEQARKVNEFDDQFQGFDQVQHRNLYDNKDHDFGTTRMADQLKLGCMCNKISNLRLTLIF